MTSLCLKYDKIKILINTKNTKRESCVVCAGMDMIKYFFKMINDL
jgi:hypothetical protein